MKKGEKRLVVVPAEMGYKTTGFYARERPNEKRFVISPNTLLVYEVERLE
jgi:FKBP-type peptidyl-prolyl cis-trans isomerase